MMRLEYGLDIRRALQVSELERGEEVKALQPCILENGSESSLVLLYL